MVTTTKTVEQIIEEIKNDKPHVRDVEIYTQLEDLVGVRDAKRGILESEKMGGEVFVCFEIAPNSVTGDTTSCVIILDLIDTEEGVHHFDTRVKIHNGDWASLRDQVAMIGACVDAFYALGLNTAFGRIVE